MRLKCNAPVTLTFSLICAAVLGIAQLTPQQNGVHTLIINWFSISPVGFSFANPLSWLHLLTHVIGHANWTHLISNFSFILLLGPILEEKYGSGLVLLTMVVTAVATGLLDIFVMKADLLGASGIAFTLILLSSFTNIRSGDIPITFLLIVALYLVKELVESFTPSPIANLAHVAGGIIGALFGFIFARREPAKAVTGHDTPTLPGT